MQRECLFRIRRGRPHETVRERAPSDVMDIGRLGAEEGPTTCHEYLKEGRRMW